KSYLQILAILYEKNFEVQWVTDPDILDARTIKLILQPVIENAFEHGIRSMKQGGRIRITGCRTEHGVEFWVEDNGRGMTEERLKEVTDYMKDSNYDPARSVGTKNVNLRIPCSKAFSMTGWRISLMVLASRISGSVSHWTSKFFS
ncbi:ATP-binding protein, partial [Blautia hominis]|nr:ATP-binding protein [Blautia hominis]